MVTPSPTDETAQMSSIRQRIPSASEVSRRNRLHGVHLRIVTAQYTANAEKAANAMALTMRLPIAFSVLLCFILRAAMNTELCVELNVVPLSIVMPSAL